MGKGARSNVLAIPPDVGRWIVKIPGEKPFVCNVVSIYDNAFVATTDKDSNPVIITESGMILTEPAEQKQEAIKEGA